MDAGDGRQARRKLAAALQELRDRAERNVGHRIPYVEIAAASGADHKKLGKRLGEWFETGCKLSPDGTAQEVISYLEGRIGHPVRTPQQWEELLGGAREEAGRNRGGRPNNSYRPTEQPLRALHAADRYRPQELRGSQAAVVLSALEEMVDSESGYLVLEAPPWSGKTALLSTLVVTSTLPKTDRVAYFVRQAAGSEKGRVFLDSMVRVLGAHAGKPRATKDVATLLTLYEAAAARSVARGRRLLLVIDGLDEDAGDPMGSIASLLPPRVSPGLTVLVSRRRNPPLPHDVPADHPLRHARRVADFRPLPEARVLRDRVRSDFDALLSDNSSWGCEVVGFLAVAGGGLTETALMQLIGTGEHRDLPLPFHLTKLLHSVAARGLCLEDVDPDEFVLAHTDLYREALVGLGPTMCAALLQRLHAWADGYREEGWPATTPGFLLHRYLDTLSAPEHLGRRAAFTLDHRRLLRLADRGRTDLGLASVDRVAQATRTPAVLAFAAASRSLLAPRGRPVPHEVLRALCMVGDGERARSLALGVADPASKAVRLAEVVRALSAGGTPDTAEQARCFAREAAGWAEQSELQANSLAFTYEWNTPAVLAAIAVVLAEVGLSVEAVRLLSGVDICRPESVGPVARTAGLLREADRAFSDRVFDELLAEADGQAESAEGDPVLAVEIWASVAAHDPGRSEQALSRTGEFAEGFAVDFPGLAAADCCAVAASAIAGSVQEGALTDAWHRARKLAAVARSLVLGALDGAPMEALGDSLALVVRALLDLGERPAEVHDLLAEFPAEAGGRAAALLDGPAGTAEETGEPETEASLRRQVQRFSALADGPQLRHHLDRYLREVAAREARVDWLPWLFEALVDAGDDVSPALVVSMTEGGDPLLRVRVLAATARAHAEGGRRHEAVRWAAEAASTAARMDPQLAEVRVLVAQAFAHAGEAAQAASWTMPPSGRRPYGRAGIPYRRAALAVRAGLEPVSFVAEVMADGLSDGVLTAAGNDVVAALRTFASGARVGAHYGSLRTTAHARLATEPLLATGLALLQAVQGDDEGARRTACEVPDPSARGVAQAAVAGCLSCAPAYLDVAGDEDGWTLSMLRVLARQLRPARAGGSPLARELAVAALGTDSWYQALPVLSRVAPDGLPVVVQVLDQHGRVAAAAIRR
ncbi:hypothetical protein OG401_12910 [Kitasatospora purpeofusca]|uniref:hypothetical protein n=1 Tax=Kitasatospora purpeofusca TaxID=67352 RepID=UPI00224F9A57|nr:hypothetical protein [Kitasatospora purpeofusca]MCX4685201.1 hypothetical protein [Kitasatospora purpeofusca]